MAFGEYIRPPPAIQLGKPFVFLVTFQITLPFAQLMLDAEEDRKFKEEENGEPGIQIGSFLDAAGQENMYYGFTPPEPPLVVQLIPGTPLPPSG